ncbi:MAG: AsmA-like C-terminal region-containing protein, partial [Cyclobacteriaceae bacterium]|nr:AsmA-like C-terminal region-containing protein [Cyclobacteriaceae bacterium]
ASEEFHLDLKSIELVNVDITKLNEEDQLMLEAFIDFARAKFKSTPNHITASIDSKFLFNVINKGDTTFIKHKHFELHTQVDFVEDQQLLVIQPSELKLEKAIFRMDGQVDMDDDMNLDIRFEGTKPNFDLFMAFAPEALAPALERYDNAGRIYFKASVTGKAGNGNLPLVQAEFGCEEAFFDNKTTHRRLDDLFFHGYFTTGEARNFSTMEFSLTDFSARPEAGIFSGKLVVKNFVSPEIDMQLRSEFELGFLADFFNINNLQNLNGSIALTMNFHDIVDLNNPEKSIEKLNEAYFTELDIRNLSFRSPAFHLPLDNLDLKATMDGHTAKIEKFNLRVGNTDISLKATISDLPAILHHTNDPVIADMVIQSKRLDIKQLTSGDTLKQKPFDENIENFSMKLKFLSSAKAFTESPNLPKGEFFIEDLYAKLTHYPHTLHDFHADVFIDDRDFRVIDFSGMIDKSDFHFNGKLGNYDLWFEDEPIGDTNMEFFLTSKLLQLEDLFAYGGENYVPEDYRHEEFRNLTVHGYADLHFNKGLKSSDVIIDRIETTMKVHPMRVEKFKGRFHYEDDHLVVEKFSGKIGKSEFVTDLNYYLGKDEDIRKRDNYFSLKATRLDFDELFSYMPPPDDKPMTPDDHEAGFNIYEVPFSDMRFDIDIRQLNYHRYLIDDFYAKARTTSDHYIHIDTLSLKAAGGMITTKGYFNGSDPKKIYFNPVMTITDVDLDKLMFKFENFGQDHMVSENLHGKLSGKLTGKIHVHKDMVPIVDDSDIQIDFTVINGRLDNYPAFEILADYFKDKNVNRVRFDTLSNKLTVSKGVMTFPRMTINSSLGFMEISGKQDMNMNMDYFVRIPWRMVTRAGMQRLFGSRKENDPEKEDEIQYRDENKRIRFLNLRITGTPDDYKISLGKDSIVY